MGYSDSSPAVAVSKALPESHQESTDEGEEAAQRILACGRADRRQNPGDSAAPAKRSPREGHFSPLLLLESQRFEFPSHRFGRRRCRHDGKFRPERSTAGWPHHARAAATVKGTEHRPAERAMKTATRTWYPKYHFQHTRDSTGSKSHMIFGDGDHRGEAGVFGLQFSLGEILP